MLTLFTVNDRYNFESAVPTQDIRSIVHNLNSGLIPMFGRSALALLPIYTELPKRIPMGPDQAYRLPHSVINVSVEAQYPITPEIKIVDTQDGFRISISVGLEYLAKTHAILDFDEYMRLTHFHVDFEPWVRYQGDGRIAVMNVLYDQLPSLLGYIVWCNSRARSSITLGEPQEYEARGSNADPTQYLGPVRDVTNPRDNPTGIPKRPHERSGFFRQNADGTKTWVPPTVVHKDRFEGEDRPKKPKF